METVRKITTGYGLWTLITASIALFFASWLAVEISLSTSTLIGAILGLTIWGLFYPAMTYLQLGTATSLIGLGVEGYKMIKRAFAIGRLKIKFPFERRSSHPGWEGAYFRRLRPQ